MKPDKITTNSAMMPEVSRLKATVHQQDGSGRQDFFKLSSENKSHVELDPLISNNKDTANKSAFIPKKSNIVEIPSCKIESNTDSNILKDNVCSMIQLRS